MVSSFFRPVRALPGVVQFLDSSVSSRLPLSISCSSLLPAHLCWLPLLWLETSKPGECSSESCHVSKRHTVKMQISAFKTSPKLYDMICMSQCLITIYSSTRPTTISTEYVVIKILQLYCKSYCHWCVWSTCVNNCGILI